ncbi:hypothetical protein WJX74_010156 [Apatococcus lobatus]|uniref:F-box domain-containing protein n=1 Tax=Apatococcus lobatus TaxID=904363 RepID=A0AAW1QZM6_9CHLO
MVIKQSKALPSDILISVFANLSFAERRLTIPLVCKHWRAITQGPSPIWEDCEIFHDSSSRKLALDRAQVIRWLGKHAEAVRQLKLCVNQDTRPGDWPQSVAGLVALMSNLQILELDAKGFFLAAKDMRALSCLTSLRKMQLRLGTSAEAFSQPAVTEPLRHLTALESLAFDLNVHSNSLQLSEDLTHLNLKGLTYLELGSNGLSQLPFGPYLEQLQILDITDNGTLEDVGCLAAATSLHTLALGEDAPVQRSSLAALLPTDCVIVDDPLMIEDD